MSEAQAEINAITQKLFFRLPEIKTEMGLVLGAGALTGLVAKRAAESYLRRNIPKFIVTGGVNIIDAPFYTQFIPLIDNAKIARPEAGEVEGEYAARIMMDYGVPENVIAIENTSTNTGENIDNSFPLGLLNARSVTLFSLAHTQWRALSTFRRYNSSAVATTVPVFPFPGVHAGNWHAHQIAAQEVRAEYAKLPDYLAHEYCAEIDLAAERRRVEVLGQRQVDLQRLER